MSPPWTILHLVGQQVSHKVPLKVGKPEMLILMLVKPPNHLRHIPEVMLGVVVGIVEQRAATHHGDNQTRGPREAKTPRRLGSTIRVDHFEVPAPRGPSAKFRDAVLPKRRDSLGLRRIARTILSGCPFHGRLRLRRLIECA